MFKTIFTNWICLKIENKVTYSSLRQLTVYLNICVHTAVMQYPLKPHLYMVERVPQTPMVSLAWIEGCSSQWEWVAHCNGSGTVRERGQPWLASVLVAHKHCLAREMLACHKQLAFAKDVEHDGYDPVQGRDRIHAPGTLRNCIARMKNTDLIL